MFPLGEFYGQRMHRIYSWVMSNQLDFTWHLWVRSDAFIFTWTLNWNACYGLLWCSFQSDGSSNTRSFWEEHEKPVEHPLVYTDTNQSFLEIDVPQSRLMESEICINKVMLTHKSRSMINNPEVICFGAWFIALKWSVSGSEWPFWIQGSKFAICDGHLKKKDGSWLLQKDTAI